VKLLLPQLPWLLRTSLLLHRSINRKRVLQQPMLLLLHLLMLLKMPIKMKLQLL